MHRAFRRWLAGIAVGSLAALGVAAAPAQAVSVRAAAAAGTSGGFTDACQPAVNGDVTCMAMTGAAIALSGTTGGTPQPLGPADLRSAYGFQSATGGSGQTVAVVSYGDYAQAAADMSAYRSAFGIAACTKASGCFKQVTYTGSTTTSTLPTATGSGYDVADAVSMDMISAVCPNCHILLVEAAYEAVVDPTTTTDDGLGAAENEAVALGAKFIVDPWGANEASLGLTTENSWDTKYFNHPGVAITAPSGDQGYSGPIYYPAASQYVIAVGGTDLQPGASGPRGYTETAWSGSGSGCAEWASKPAWQTDTGCSARRMLNDVAAAATDGSLGIAYDNTSSGSGLTAGQGDAFSAAIIAAAYALAGTPANDIYPASYLYGNTNGLYDITAEDTSTPIACVPTYFCNAGTGYDGPTGLGTPDGVSALLSSYYQPITPLRLMDTRIGTGGTTGPVPSNATVKLKIAGAQGIPSANVTAVALNLTARDESSSGILNVWPDGTPRPITSNVNYQASTTIANLVIVPVGANGSIDIFNGSAGTVQLIGDVFGYFTSDPSAAGDTTYTPVTPVRILDTRVGTGGTTGQLAPGSALAVQVGGANGIPPGISAVAVNITSADSTSTGYLTYYADGTPLPGVSNLQYDATNIAEMAIVPVGADGKIDIRACACNASGTNVIADVVGYFSAGTTGETYRTTAPTRMIDTRQSAPVAAGGTLGVPQGTTVIAPSPTLIVNVTAVDGTAGGDFIIYPAGISPPGTSNLNWSTTDSPIANLDLAATGSGTFDIYNASNGTTDVVVDCFGYWAAG